MNFKFSKVNIYSPAVQKNMLDIINVTTKEELCTVAKVVCTSDGKSNCLINIAVGVIKFKFNSLNLRSKLIARLQAVIQENHS